MSLGVISSSVGPSETALTSAIARRMCSATACVPAKPAELLGGPPGLDHQSPIRLLADADRCDVGVIFECQVDGAALEGLHRVKGYRVARHLDLARGSEGDLAHRVLAALAVAL